MDDNERFDGKMIKGRWYFLDNDEEVGYVEIVEILNEQDKRIKELENELGTYKRKFLECVDRKMGDVK